jgi:hypothetical protein
LHLQLGEIALHSLAAVPLNAGAWYRLIRQLLQVQMEPFLPVFIEKLSI